MSNRAGRSGLVRNSVRKESKESEESKEVFLGDGLLTLIGQTFQKALIRVNPCLSVNIRVRILPCYSVCALFARDVVDGAILEAGNKRDAGDGVQIFKAEQIPLIHGVEPHELRATFRGPMTSKS